MASNDVNAGPMIIKAKESQPLPSEAFIVPREGSKSKAEFLVGSIVGNFGGLVWPGGNLWLQLHFSHTAPQTQVAVQ